MALKTQGSQLYIIDPEPTGGPAVLAIECALSVSGIEVPREQLETTCLESEARTYEPGLPSPGQLTFELNFDPATPSHKRVYDLWRDGIKLEMALGYSDGTSAPDVDTSGLFDLPTDRSFIVFHDAYFANVPQELQLNSMVKANVAVQLSGFPDLMPKS